MSDSTNKSNEEMTLEIYRDKLDSLGDLLTTERQKSHQLESHVEILNRELQQ